MSEDPKPMNIDEHYSNEKLAMLFDTDCPWGADKDFYLSLPERAHSDILDLGCGTGQLCEAYAAKGHRVMGVDPAGPMLAMARQKPHGHMVEWQEATAQSFETARMFDLVIMTGHAFQVLLTDEDIVNVFKRIATHLQPNGKFVFESRNPALDWMKIWSSTPERNRHFVPVLDERERKVFERHYLLPSETLISRSELRFCSKDKIQRHLAAVGLKVEQLFGDWDWKEFEPRTSPEMIFVTAKVR